MSKEASNPPSSSVNDKEKTKAEKEEQEIQEISEIINLKIK